MGDAVTLIGILLLGAAVFAVIVLADDVIDWAKRRLDETRRLKTEQAVCPTCHGHPLTLLDTSTRLCQPHREQWQRIRQLEREALDG